MPRRQRSDSLFTAIQEAREATESDVEPPEGVALETEEQVTIWRQRSEPIDPPAPVTKTVFLLSVLDTNVRSISCASHASPTWHAC